MQRCEIKSNVNIVEQAGSLAPANDNDYWLFELGPARQLPGPLRIGGVRSFRFRLQSAQEMLSGKPWHELDDRYPGLGTSWGQ